MLTNNKISTMVMKTRSSLKRACESYESSGSSRNGGVPPWCSRGKFKEKKKDRNVAPEAWKVHSAYPIRENIWEYLQEDKKNFFTRKSRTCCKQPAKKRGAAVISLVFLSAIVGIITCLCMYYNQNKKTGLITRVTPKTTLISLLDVDCQSTSVDEECCSKMKHLAAALFRAERALRSNLRVRRTLMLTSQMNKIASPNTIDRGYIGGVTVSRGEGTEEWHIRATMWGVVPLWMAPPPPSIMLTTSRPIPSDCWPISGSTGELIFDLPSTMQVRCISIEHVQPDTALSAPRLFQVYGILSNGTWIKSVYGEYRHSGPVKQYYLTLHKDVPVEKLVFRVLSNHGNPRYTCIYRVHLYSNDVDNT